MNINIYYYIYKVKIVFMAVTRQRLTYRDKTLHARTIKN